MAVLGITMFCKLKLGIFYLGPFGGSHGVDCILWIIDMVEYVILSHTRNLESGKCYINTPVI